MLMAMMLMMIRTALWTIGGKEALMLMMIVMIITMVTILMVGKEMDQEDIDPPMN